MSVTPLLVPAPEGGAEPRPRFIVAGWRAEGKRAQSTGCDPRLPVALSPNGARGDSPEPALSEVEGATPWVCVGDRASPVRAKQRLLSRPFRALLKGCLFLCSVPALERHRRPRALVRPRHPPPRPRIPRRHGSGSCGTTSGIRRGVGTRGSRAHHIRNCRLGNRGAWTLRSSGEQQHKIVKYDVPGLQPGRPGPPSVCPQPAP